MTLDVPATEERALRRRGLTLFLLTLTYFACHMDRTVLSILLEPIRKDLRLSDTQLGLLAGLAFAIFYATLGIPVARLADRGNRRNIVAISLAVWSLFTGVCGLAQNFVQLLVARVGVGVGEAGSSPPSVAMIADLYPPERRAGAMGIYSTGILLGSGFGAMAGGVLGGMYGWRIAIVLVGFPGMLLAIAVRLFVVEPPRGMSDPAADRSSAQPSVSKGFVTLWQEPAARHLVAALTAGTLIASATGAFGPAFFVRSFGMTISSIGLILGPLVAIVGALSGVLGGRFADALARTRGLHFQSWLVAALTLISMPFAVGMYLAGSLWLCVTLMSLMVLFQSTASGPTLALLQGLAPLRLRAMWAAVAFLMVNLLGFGLGPIVIGAVSDFYRPSVGEESLRYASLTMVLLTPWPIFHYWRAGVLLKRRPAAIDR